MGSCFGGTSQDYRKGRKVDWNKAVVIGSQCVVVMVLGALVAVGKDSYITDALLAISGSLVGCNILERVTKK